MQKNNNYYNKIQIFQKKIIILLNYKLKFQIKIIKSNNINKKLKFYKKIIHSTKPINNNKHNKLKQQKHRINYKIN